MSLIVIVALVVITVIAAWLASERTADHAPPIFPDRYALVVELLAYDHAERERRIQEYVEVHIEALDIQIAPIWRVVREERAERLLTAREN